MYYCPSHRGRHYGPISSGQRQDHARHKSRTKAIESSGRGTRAALWDQRKDRKKVAIQNRCHRCADGAKGVQKHCSLSVGGSCDRLAEGSGPAATG